MFLLGRLIYISVLLFILFVLFLNNFDNKHNILSYKIYLFLFVFIINFLYTFFANLFNQKKINIKELIRVSVDYALISVISFSVYNDLEINNTFINFTHEQKILILVLLIIGFITTIKILELIISSN